MLIDSTPSAEGINHNKKLEVIDMLLHDKHGNPIDVDEVKFSAYLSQRYNLICVGDKFYRSNGEADELYVLTLIQRTIEPYFNTNLDFRTKKLLRAAKNNLRRPAPIPKEGVIHVKNGTVTVSKDNIMFVNDKEFTLNELNVNYEPSTKCHTWCYKYLPELLIDEDILTLQEYFGYCLEPTLKGQKFLLVLGVKGGEGKSQMGLLLKEIFGKSCYYGGKLGDLQENRFSATVLENRLLFIDDDLENKKLNDVKYIASLVTTPWQKSEAKGKDQREFNNYCRLMAFGNNALSSLYDKSDALPRRMLLLKTKPKPIDRVDDRFLIDKLIAEKEGVLNWALEGLQRLKRNNYNFTISDRAKEEVNSLQDEGDNIRGFLRDDSVILLTGDENDSESTNELYSRYDSWCNLNGETSTSHKSFSSYLKNFSESLGIEYVNRVSKSRTRGFKGIRIMRNGGIVRNEK